MNCKMLTFDISTTYTGYSIWENGILKTYDDIDYSKEKNTDKRISKMTIKIIEKIVKEKPTIVIFESLNVIKSIKVAMAMSELIGACKACCIINDIWFDRLSPSEWRKLVADKEEKIPKKREICKPWDIKKVKDILNVDTDNDNIADAILIGEAYKRLYNKEI